MIILIITQYIFRIVTVSVWQYSCNLWIRDIA